MLRQFWDWIVLNVVGKCNWQWVVALFNNGKYWKLTNDDWNTLHKMCSENHYLIVTRRKTHLTTYLIALGGLIRGRLDYWSHCLLNAEDEVIGDDDFRFIEATGKGVHFSEFSKVFDCDSVALLIPKGFTESDWSVALEDAAKQIGKPYDTVFNCLQDNALSCIELIRHVLKATPDYDIEFSEFEAMFRKYKTLTPTMLYQCNDFQVVFEVRR